MTITSSSIPAAGQAGGKSGTLLAALASDAGAAKRPGPNFAQLLGSLTQPSARPSQPPLPERAPLPRVEVEPPVRQADVPRSTEPVHMAADRAPAPTPPKEDKPASPDAAKTAHAGSSAGNKPGSTAGNTPGTAAKAKTAPASGPAAKPSARVDAGTGASAQADEAAADVSATGKRAAKSTEAPGADDPGASMAAALTAAQPPEAAGLPARDAAAAAAKPDGELKSAAAAPEPAADPAALSSLMPSVAQAVFGQTGPAAEASGTAVGARTEGAGAGITTPSGDGALPDAAMASAATQPGIATRAKADPLDAGTASQALTGPGRGGNAESSALALAGGAQESAKALPIDGKPQAGAASFGQMLQAAGAATSVGSNAPQQAAAAATPVNVYTPLHEPGFAPEMSSRLTLLASEGVQKAQLHLNPADMGPVSVQIQLDGQQAQVEFHAQHAATREVLERSLPELAAALRDAGMTLSGGGVFQQPRDTQQDGQAQHEASGQGAARTGQAANGGGSGDPVPAQNPQGGRRSQQGVLDMYA